MIMKLSLLDFEINYLVFPRKILKVLRLNRFFLMLCVV